VRDGDWIIALIVGLIGAAVAVILISASQLSQWEDWCEAQGGHVDTSTKVTTGVGVGGNGQVVVTTGSSTTYFCLTADGRILDIR
jgi:hypothetical protein